MDMNRLTHFWHQFQIPQIIQQQALGGAHKQIAVLSGKLVVNHRKAIRS